MRINKVVIIYLKKFHSIMKNLKNKKFVFISLILMSSLFILSACTKVSLTGSTTPNAQNGAPMEGGTPPDGFTPPADGETPPTPPSESEMPSGGPQN